MVEIYKNNDDGFRDWLRNKDNNEKFVLNARVNASGEIKPLKMHNSFCPTLRPKKHGQSMTKDYIKICGTNEEIDSFMKENHPDEERITSHDCPKG